MRLTLALTHVAGTAAAESARPIAGAFAEPTDRYPHGILGDLWP